MIKVHWYNIRIKNVLIGKYTLEILDCTRSKGNRKWKKNICNTSTLNINEVDMIVYDFTLTKVGRLRKSTADIIKKILPTLQVSLIKGEQE